MENIETNLNQIEEEILEQNENPETPTESDTSEAEIPPEPDNAERLAEMLLEAERRGYLKAMNERAEKLFNAPVAGERAEQPKSPQVGKPVPGFAFLNNPRKSVWE